jgi:hypothetical protein
VITSRLFIVCVFVLLLLPVAQMMTGALPVQPLAGAQVVAERPTVSVDGVAHKRFQRSAEEWFGQQYGLHDYLLKTNNQILFTAFGDAKGKEEIVVGRRGLLLRDPYIKSTLQFAKRLDFGRVVQRLRLIQRQLRARGRTLVVFVTPSKSSIYPEAIPEAYLAFPHYEPGANYRNFVDLVRQTELPLVDAVQLIAQAKLSDSHPVFPRGGIHWNETGSYLAARALLAGIEHATGKKIGDLSVESTRYDEVPEGSDRDYANLLNLWWPPVRYEVPHVRLRAARWEQFGALSGVFSGGSFCEKVLFTYSTLGVFKEMTYVMYNARVLRYHDAARGLTSIDTLDWNAEVLGPDFIVLELNEGIMDTDDPEQAWNGFLKDLLAHLERSP